MYIIYITKKIYIYIYYVYIYIIYITKKFYKFLNKNNKNYLCNI